jgi:hypothetical protein
MHLKQISQILLFASIVLVNLNSLATDKPIDYSSGEVKIVKIMSNEETGISAYNKKNVKFAESQNLANDLNISEIAKFFECKTLIGRSFIEETLKYPVGSEDKDSVLANRQSVIKELS